MPSRNATIVEIDGDAILLRVEATCRGCSGCHGTCQSFRFTERRSSLLGLPRSRFPRAVRVGEEVELSIGERRLRGLALRSYAAALLGVLAGGAAAALLARLLAWPADGLVLGGALAGCMLALRLARASHGVDLVQVNMST